MKRKISKQSKEEYMFSLIAERVNSGRSIKSLCDQHNIQPSNWFYRQKKYQRRQTESSNTAGSFTLLQLPPDLIASHDSGIFAEYRGSNCTSRYQHHI